MKNYAAVTLSIAILVGVGFGFSSCKDDEPPVPPKLSFAESTMTVSEADGTIEVELVLDKPYSKDLTIEYELAGTAKDQGTYGTADADYEIDGTPEVVTIRSGQTSGIIEIEIYDDFAFEEDETIEISIMDINTSDVQLTAEDETVITITNDDTQVVASFTNTTMTVNEADGLEELILVPVQLDQAAPNDITLEYTIDINLEDQTKNPAIDSTFGFNNEIPPNYYDYYIHGTTGQLVIPQGTTSANIEIALLSDYLLEDDETIEITLSPSTSAQLGTNKTITITVQQQDGKVIALIWENASYTDVDMDLFLWSGPDVNTLTRLQALSASEAVNPKIELVFIPSVVRSATFGLSHNYYAGTADPMTFEVHFADFANGVIEPLADRDVFTATYTKENINPWFESKVNPVVVQTFRIVDGAYVDISEITVPTSGSRMRINQLPAGLRRTDAMPSVQLF